MKELEDEIIRTARESVGKAIETTLTGYSSPLTKLINNVIERRAGEFETIIDEVFCRAVLSADFKERMKESAMHRVAKVLVEKLGGEVEKQVNALKSNPTTRAKITLAIEQICKENSVQ